MPDESVPMIPLEPAIKIEKEVSVMDSILLSTKKQIGIEPSYEAFDADIIMDINSVFMILNQMGVGPKKAYSITDKNNVWTEFLGERVDLEAVKTYVPLRVKVMFDTITSSTQMEAINNVIKELEIRMYMACDIPISEED